MFFNFVLLFLGSPPTQKKQKKKKKDEARDCHHVVAARRQMMMIAAIIIIFRVCRVMCFLLLKDEDAYGRETQPAASGALSTCFIILFFFFFPASLFVFRHKRNKIIHFPYRFSIIFLFVSFWLCLNAEAPAVP